MPGPSPGRDDARSTAALDAGPCDVCGGRTLELRCKIICQLCGYTRDCADP